MITFYQRYQGVSAGEGLGPGVGVGLGCGDGVPEHLFHPLLQNINRVILYVVIVYYNYQLFKTKSKQWSTHSCTQSWYASGGLEGHISMHFASEPPGHSSVSTVARNATPRNNVRISQTYNYKYYITFFIFLRWWWRGQPKSASSFPRNGTLKYETRTPSSWTHCSNIFRKIVRYILHIFMSTNTWVGDRPIFCLEGIVTNNGPIEKNDWMFVSFRKFNFSRTAVSPRQALNSERLFGCQTELLVGLNRFTSSHQNHETCTDKYWNSNFSGAPSVETLETVAGCLEALRHQPTYIRSTEICSFQNMNFCFLFSISVVGAISVTECCTGGVVGGQPTWHGSLLLQAQPLSKTRRAKLNFRKDKNIQSFFYIGRYSGIVGHHALQTDFQSGWSPTHVLELMIYWSFFCF